MSNLRIIIPCAGFGTRMGMPSDKSKELLINPRTGNSLIEDALSKCYRWSGDPFLIIRKEKQDLIDFCNKFGIEYMVVGSTKEWPETLLLSKNYWKDHNLVLLPDIEFENQITHYVSEWIKNYKDFFVGYHEVDDLSKWGSVDLNGIEEKPQDKKEQKGTAWGVLGFRNIKYFTSDDHQSHGEKMLNSFLSKEKFKYISSNVQYCELVSFKDLTRTGKIE